MIYVFYVSLQSKYVSNNLGLTGFDSGLRWYVSTRRLLWLPP